uniref:Uncharacterized protein n=1 Tax=Rhizophora mucronata TaxID=61149 RepID=A0A2P2QX84_RHIMU
MAASKAVYGLSSRLQALANSLNKKPSCPQLSPLQSSPPSLVSVSARRLSRRPSRLPLHLSCIVESMMPFHGAIASARLISSLSSESDSWGLVPQGWSLIPVEIIICSCLNTGNPFLMYVNCI